MVSLMANGGGSQYDLVSASGDADLRLIYGGDVRPINITSGLTAPEAGAPVPSCCKTVIGQRLKQSGMHWTVSGADAIAALRCQQASRPEDR
ncbi:MAG: hypothetical protein ACRDPO_12570, partial [Streptosporangiaceae bacterium]